MSHHQIVYDKEGHSIGHLRITNDGVVLSAWILDQFLEANPAMNHPEEDDEERNECICREDNIEVNCPECFS